MDRRLAALEQDDDLEYAKAFYESDYRKLVVATEVEDIIFDHFGVVEMQYQASKNFHNED